MILKKNRILSVLSLTAVFAFSVLLTSCSNDDEKDMIDLPGQIPGLGDNKGELAGTEFKLPEGLQLDGDILSSSVSEYYNIGWWHAKGSGETVNVTLSLKNLTDRDIEVEFPAGLIVKSLSGEYPHGVLLKKTQITVLANDETQYFILEMYSGNSSLDAASLTDPQEYKFAVVSNSSLIVDLCNRLANKKINKEEWAGRTDDYNYTGYSSMIQIAFWGLTNNTGLTESDIEHIDSLPDSSK